MISISGIEYQKELESLPFFNKSQARLLIGKTGRNLDAKLAQLKKVGYLVPLKKNLYVTDPYYQQTNRSFYGEYLAGILRSPSYLSLEYILAKEGIIPEGIVNFTSITLKSSRTYKNVAGTFLYRNLKPILFTGYIEDNWDEKIIRRATRAKALFDWLYLQKLSHPSAELSSDLRINWDRLTFADINEFGGYVSLSQSAKMSRILKIIQKIYVHR
ncbi:hypothetical protein A3A75_00750 [Candidatus Woesebacteria bacterium RIFCSPLOWO2_01_FULL_39_10]|uniref:AbiEi antitoxin C-terminal domain-containing protein n=1 Tax=Candidatus Woesebacteria bacterium RIFCSPLOWO2_01_FULL_39_10 TaxID=1802516 RepID=A0A1F8B397_9BACT|nr:MAG: hypothetical protein A3A75_00750 [Candidatus Woesebacteria bacterium RIFCSPLOWO2_01_FULL_39_10]